MVCGFGVEIDTVTIGFDAAAAALAERGCNSISLHSNTIQLTSNCYLMFFSLALSGSKTKCSLTCKSHFTRTGWELGWLSLPEVCKVITVNQFMWISWVDWSRGAMGRGGWAGDGCTFFTRSQIDVAAIKLCISQSDGPMLLLLAGIPGAAAFWKERGLVSLDYILGSISISGGACLDLIRFSLGPNEEELSRL